MESAICMGVLGGLGMVLLHSGVAVMGKPSLVWWFYVYIACLVLETIFGAHFIAYTIRVSRVKCIPVILLIALYPLIPYGIVEAQTYLSMPLLYEPACEALNKTYFSSEVPANVDMKVLHVTDAFAMVYIVVPPNHHSAVQGADSEYFKEIVELIKTDDGWKYKEDSWSLVWDDTRLSVEGIIFPPYASTGDY